MVKKDLTPFEAAEAELRALVELKRKQVSFGRLFFNPLHFGRWLVSAQAVFPTF